MLPDDNGKSARDKFNAFAPQWRKQAMKEAGISVTGRTNKHPEADVSKAIREWLTYHHVFFFRCNSTGSPLQGGGWRPSSTRGIPDFICIIPHEGHGIFCGIEAKSEVGKQSEDQKAFEEEVKNAKGYYYVIRNISDLEKFVKLQKTKTDSANSWSVNVTDIDQDTFDLSVKNPKGGEEIKHRSPKEIMREIAALDAESAEVLGNIKALL